MRITTAFNRANRLALAAATALAVGSAGAQTPIEPEGTPVYRHHKSTFFQNPFSTTYQRLWKRAQAESAPAADEVVYEDYTEPAAPAHRAAAQRRTARPASPSGPGLLQRMVGRPQPARPVQARPTASPAARSMAAMGNRPMQTPSGAKVIHVDDVNQGTPAVGTIYEVNTPHPEIVRSLAEGEQVLKVTERVIGVYRDGKLVTVDEKPRTHQVLKPNAPQIDVDPWFGDAVTAPTDEIQAFEEDEHPVEALPPQSWDAPAAPSLPAPSLPAPLSLASHVEPATSDHAGPMMVLPMQAQAVLVIPVQCVAQPFVPPAAPAATPTVKPTVATPEAPATAPNNIVARRRLAVEPDAVPMDLARYQRPAGR
jgi:hypothetical protein